VLKGPKFPPLLFELCDNRKVKEAKTIKGFEMEKRGRKREYIL
jgi:hypothetical protein